MASNLPTNEDVLAFVQHNWLWLAAASWRHYMRHGRGALIIDFEDVQRWKQGQAFQREVDYLTTIDNDEVQKETATYDPQTTIVVFTTSGTKELAKQGKWRTLPTVIRFNVSSHTLSPEVDPVF